MVYSEKRVKVIDMTKKETVVESVDYTVENQALFAQLTKRNEQYMHDLEKTLALANVSETKLEKIKYDTMSQMVSGQKTGATARQLFGTVSEYSKQLLTAPTRSTSEVSEDWKLFLDGGLLMGSLFMVISGFTTSSETLGVLSLLLNYVISGAVMLLLSKASARYQKSFQEQRRGKAFLRYMVDTFSGMILWIGGVFAISALPEVINPKIPPIACVVIGLVTFALRFYLKKKLDIRGTII